MVDDLIDAKLPTTRTPTALFPLALADVTLAASPDTTMP